MTNDLVLGDFGTKLISSKHQEDDTKEMKATVITSNAERTVVSRFGIPAAMLVS